MKYLNDVRYKDCVGKVFKSTSSGDFKVLKYNDARDVEIQFLNTGYETVAHLGNIKMARLKTDTYRLFTVLEYWALSIQSVKVVLIQKSMFF